MPFLLLAVILWGSSFIAGKFAYQMLSPLLLVQARLVISAVVMLPFLILGYQKARGHLVQLALLGLATFPVTFLLQFYGLYYTSAASAATMLGVEPLMLLLVGALFFKERLKSRDLLLAGAAFIGVLLVVWQPQDANITVFGCALVLVSTVIVAFWLRISQGMIRDIGSMSYTAYTLLFGAIFCLPITLIFNHQWQIHYQPSALVAVIYLGIACSVVTSWAWNKGLLQTGAHFAAMMLVFEPVFAVVFAVILLGEVITPRAIVGTGLIILTTVLSARANRHRDHSA